MRKIRDFKTNGATDPAVSVRERENRALARKAAAEGMVLLKNEDLLPMPANRKIALLGSGARYTYKGGTGSGDVNERDYVTIDQGLSGAGFTIVSRSWLEDYDTRYQAARMSWRDRLWGDGSEETKARFFEIYSTNPFFMPEGRPITDSDIEEADAAVYVVSRSAGEGKDRMLIEGDYYLTKREMEDLAFLDAHGLPTVLLVNSGGPVELTQAVKFPYLKAILYVAQPGQEGGNAIADIITGAVNPSGKLTATWAEHFSDYPCSESFSYLDGNVTKEYYREGIYVGYRWFDSFGIRPLFGFGYGLSYTRFEISKVQVREMEILTDVTNTGSVSGRETVQIYASLPAGKLPKERRRLIAFAKTPLLAPGETAQLRLPIRVRMLTSYDEEASAWILEAGNYGLWAGSSLDEAKPFASLVLTETVVPEQVSRICPLREELREIDAPAFDLPDWAAYPREVLDIESVCADLDMKSISDIGEEGLATETEAEAEAEHLAGLLSAKQLLPLLMGNISGGANALGSAGIRVPGSAGETCTAFIDSLGLGSAVMADGPAGLRLSQMYEADPDSGRVYDPGFLASIEHGLFEKPVRHEDADLYYQFCTAFPVGVLLAQSFDTALLEEVGAAVAREMEEFHVSWWLAPGMNIQRNPLCGRNFEYYSEDPLISGKMAAAITRGVQRLPGVGTTIKHLACNNQEDNRIGSDSILSERALREIYLRGFEIAVRESQPMCIMTSYNLVNGVHAANSYDLCTTAARNEWGFRGIIMSDWTTTLPEAGSIPYLCAKAGNDLIMPGMPGDLTDLAAAYERGDLTDAEIRACAKRLIRVILRTNAYEEVC